MSMGLEQEIEGQKNWNSEPNRGVPSLKLPPLSLLSSGKHLTNALKTPAVSFPARSHLN
jgi:hypothetical protein